MFSPSTDLVRQATLIAQQHSLDPSLVCAVVEQESSWETHSLRYEPAFRSHYVTPLGLSPTEEIARSISWGLMQVMGQVAREHGFSEKFLSALCEPAKGLTIGCVVLASKLSEADGDISRALALAVPQALRYRRSRQKERREALCRSRCHFREPSVPATARVHYGIGAIESVCRR
jgi:soluble lytic murein transglycosylase-like protein